MPIAKEKGGDFTPAPEGTFVARCFGVISLGTQHSQNFADAFKVMVLWELPTETITVDKEVKPMTISKEYTLSLSKKSNLRRDLESWRGRAFSAEELEGFAVEKVIGQPCMITVTHKISGQGKTYAAVTAVTRLLKGAECPGQHHENVHFEVEHGRGIVFDSLPEWVRKKIEACEEWNSPSPTHTETPESDGDGDLEVPF